MKSLFMLAWCLAMTSLFGADNRPLVYFTVTRVADEDTKEDSWIAMGRKPPVADDTPNCWYWYPRYGKPFFAVVTPVTVSDFAIFGVRFYGLRRFQNGMRVSFQLNIFNVLDDSDPQITRYDATGTYPRRFTVVEPRTFRLTTNIQFK